jgi:alanyl-tRNA synthetase
MTGAELREKFLSYFEERGHARVPSSSLIPVGDATLLFTNAGMVQFKDVFTGAEKRPYVRATTSQKCLRVSGKHNDLENVGHTPRHHTFFEMLGNFSFGDYFKDDAVNFGWEFLTDVVGLPKKDLYVTIYTDDDEADQIWRKVTGLGSDRISRLGEKDNFWSMGDTGPCGPCSEIHIDQGESAGCGSLDCAPGCDCDRYLELWNLVFMQFERSADGTLSPLPRPSIDTGLGLERLAAVVQGVRSNWESDLFQPLIGKVTELADGDGPWSQSDVVAMRVIADHSRAAAFLIADGVLPSNEGRGYVLRRILRRAIRYGMQMGMGQEPFLFKTAQVVVDRMSQAYPELVEHASHIERYVFSEEERFLETLGKGTVIFEGKSGSIPKGGKVPGDLAFLLYDTYGFPLDVTVDMAEEKGLSVDQAGFKEAMERQRTRAREARTGNHWEDTAVIREILDSGTSTTFTGYETFEDSGVIKAVIKDGKQVDAVQAGDTVEVVADRTPFYGESGGQVGDRGRISANGSEMVVEDAVKPFANLTIHRGTVKSGRLKVGDKVNLKVDADARLATMSNHSATHIVHWALRTVLGDHVKQRGSLVEPQRFRFDFTHFSAISEEELDRIEELVNRRIRQNAEVTSRLLSMNEAVEEGAIALFDEKYGDTVRMISMGDFSKELCGGTHTSRTGDIGFFKIISEGGIAAGVRRIEAVTGQGAFEHVRVIEREIREVAERLRASRGEIVHKLDKMIEEKKSRDREVESLKAKLAGGMTTDIMDGLREIENVNVLTRIIETASDPKDLRQYGDKVRDRLKSGVALLGAAVDGKVFLLAIVTKDLTDRFHAGKLVKKASEAVGGKGGGRPDMAQGGGPDVAKLEQALELVDAFITDNL